MQRAHGIEYETGGHGEAILMLHGAIIADVLAPLMAEPALGGSSLIRYRRRGYGGSDPPIDPPTVEEQAHDARLLLEFLGVPRAHVVAYSGGGPIAVQLALDQPVLVRSLVLIEPALQNAAMASAFHELIAPLIAMHRAGDSAKAVDRWMRTVAGPGWGSELEQQLPGVEEHLTNDAAGTFEYDLEALHHWDFDSVGTSRLEQPVLYIVSERNAERQQSVVQMVRNAAPHMQLVTIPDTDHMLVLSRPDLVAQVIADFVSFVRTPQNH